MSEDRKVDMGDRPPGTTTTISTPGVSIEHMQPTPRLRWRRPEASATCQLQQGWRIEQTDATGFKRIFLRWIAVPVVPWDMPDEG